MPQGGEYTRQETAAAGSIELGADAVLSRGGGSASSSKWASFSVCGKDAGKGGARRELTLRAVRLGRFSAVSKGLERFAGGLNCSKLLSGCDFRAVQCGLERFSTAEPMV